MPVPRPFTNAEKAVYLKYFPDMDVDAVVVTGEVDDSYNCVAWTLGVSDDWYWPGYTLAEFNAYYKIDGYNPTPTGSVAAWGFSTKQMTHACVQGPGHGPRWESKIGPYQRIQHALPELQGPDYGVIQEFYTRQGPPPVILTLERGSGDGRNNALVGDDSAKLKAAVAAVREDLRVEFGNRFQLWKKTWFGGDLRFDSNPYSRAAGPEFAAMAEMGPPVTSLVIETLTHPENFFALTLVEAVSSGHYFVNPIEIQSRKFLSERARASRVVWLWLQGMKI